MPSLQPDHPRYRLLTRPGSRKLVVCFTGTGEVDGRFHFFGQATRSGEHALLLNNGSNVWYQNGVPGLGDTLEETIATIRAIADDLGVQDIYCMGGSMGGAGAALYGSLLGARVLAFGFETRLDLPQSRSNKLKPPGHVFPIPDFTHLIAAATKPLHVYLGSSDVVDLMATSHIHTLPMVTLASMRNVGHGPAGYLKKRERLDPLVRNFLDDGPPVVVPEADVAHSTAGFPEALHEALCGFATKDYPRWETAAREAVRLMGTSAPAHLSLGRLLLVTDRPQEAMMHLATATSLDNVNPREAACYFAMAVRHTGQLDHAFSLQKKNIRNWTRHAPSYYELGLISMMRGQKAKAVDFFETAISLSPSNTNYQDRLARLKATMVSKKAPQAAA